ncbi:MAG TPA: DUF2059 domain-containing protein [Cellvibrionaceae bacterium]
MKKLFVIVTLMLAVTSARAEEPVYTLIDLMGGQDQMTQMHNQFVSMIASSSPEMTAYVPVVQEWAETYLSWDEMREPMAAIYKKYFSKEEIAKLVEFYQSPVGKKSIELMPVLFQEGGQIGMEMAQKHQGELERMLEAAKAEAEGETASPEATE